jgi:DNA topoisomerase-3
MSKLVIAEKPSVAKDLAKVLNVRSRGDGFYEGQGWLITWCIGHLVELCEPHEYNSKWKYWSLNTLPMIPSVFQLRAQKDTRKQFEVVKKLLLRRDVTEVINACDAGREGELIFRYVYLLAGASKPIKRLWISSMTDEAIQRGFEQLRQGEDYDRLWYAARCRSEADWLVGINATRAMTLRVREFFASREESPLMSIGRVQTPTLALVVHREQEIINFVPRDYWQIMAMFQAEAGNYLGKWFREEADPSEKSGHKKIDRFFEEEEARQLVSRLSGHGGIVQKVDKFKTVERPPLLFDLNRLQRAANKRYAFSAAYTLELAQALYEKHKLITYPRTDSNHLPTDMIAEIPAVIKAVGIGVYEAFSRYILALAKLPTHNRIFDNRKISDHHAIIPTPKTPALDRLSHDESKIYDLVVRYFLAAFYPDAVFDKTTIITNITDESFVSQGKVLVERGWRVVIGLSDDYVGASPPKKAKSSDGDDQAEVEEEEFQGILPSVKKKQSVAVNSLDLQAKQTKPPPRYNEGTLLAAMEGAGKLLDEEELKTALKDSGLGTPATRANIIETLIKRRYIERKRKTLHPTQMGMQLINFIPSDNLKSPELTGRWEAQLSRIARGEEQPNDFQQRVRNYVFDLIQALKHTSIHDPSDWSMNQSGSPETADPEQPTHTASTDSPPSTTTKRSRRSPSSAPTTATGAEGPSKTKSSRTKAKSTSTSDGEDKPKRRSRAKSAASIDDSTESTTKTKVRKTTMAKTSAVPLSEHAASPPDSIGRCPFCDEGKMIWGRQAWGCNRWKEGCNTQIPYIIQGRKLHPEEARQLLNSKATIQLSDFQDPDTGHTMFGVLQWQTQSAQNKVIFCPQQIRSK